MSENIINTILFYYKIDDSKIVFSNFSDDGTNDFTDEETYV